MIEELFKELLVGIYKIDYIFTDEFKSLFTPNCFKKAESKVWFYKLDYQNVIVYDDSYQHYVNEIIEKIRYFSGSVNRNVYRSEYYKQGTFCSYQTEETEDYLRHVLYINHRYVVQLITYKKELALNTNNVVILKTKKSIGRESMIDINERLRNAGTIKEDETLQKHLVGVNGHRYMNVFKLSIPNQISYIKKTKVQQIIDHCYKADVSSAFPSQLLKSIPTTKRCLINKIKEPTEKYPFVFHVVPGMNCGFVKIYNELDSEIDLQNKFMQDIILAMKKSEKRTAIKETINKEMWIACKAANITLKEVMTDLYAQKLAGTTEEEISKAKMTMNAFIGYCQLNKKPILSFISAVVIARQNHAMLERCKQLENEGNQVLYIATDSIVWRGQQSSVSTDNKYLGSFTNEYSDCNFYGVQVGAYQIEKDGFVKTFCSYLVNDDYKKNLKIGELPLPKKGNIKLWQK